MGTVRGRSLSAPYVKIGSNRVDMLTIKLLSGTKNSTAQPRIFVLMYDM